MSSSGHLLDVPFKGKNKQRGKGKNGENLVKKRRGELVEDETMIETKRKYRKKKKKEKKKKKRSKIFNATWNDKGKLLESVNK